MVYGAIIGFLVLDQRDDHTITALQVTPLTLSGYLGYRVAVPTLLGVLVTLFIIPVSGLVQMSAWSILLVRWLVRLLRPYQRCSWRRLPKTRCRVLR
jgi:fluoroquinolone transport system permease protein